jgi:FemAB-related protein (PEP-CTERM system-associated)
MQIKQLSKQDASRWNDFVLSCPEATFFHRAEWKEIIEVAFGHKTYFLYAEQDGKIYGVLPLAHNKSLLFGNSLCSLPFCVYGGVAAESEGVRLELEKSAEHLASQLGVDFLELRNIIRQGHSWPGKELYVTFRKEIDPDPEVNMKAIPRKQRAMVRKGIKAGLVTEIDDDVGRFFKIYSQSVRDHGTPVFSRKYFKLLKQLFGEECEVSVVSKEGVPISTVMSFYFRDEVLPYYGGGTQDARKYKGFDFMYWDLMQRVCQQGVRIFDYGRSKKGTGSYSFKKNWGFIPEDLSYKYRLVKSKKSQM